MGAFYSSRWERMAAVFVALTLLNFGLFVAGTIYFGGDAVAGYSGNGHYYLGEKQRFTEVSRQVFLIAAGMSGPCGRRGLSLYCWPG